MVKLSIVIPVYNAETYIKQCLESVCRQELEDMEIILVDDGSEDKSGTICEMYAKYDSRITVIHQDNSGPLRARYVGVMRAEGKYITFVDSDDWIDEGTYAEFKSQLDRDIDLIIFGKKLYKEGSGTTNQIFAYDEGIYRKEDIEENIYPSMIWNFDHNKPDMTQSLCDKIFKREFLLKSYEMANTLPKIHYGEDPLILYPILQWVNVIYISHKTPYYYRQRVKQTPAYINEDDFFKKASIWFEYLKKNISGIANGRKQLEYLYLNMLEGRKEIYGDLVKNEEFFFPFDKVPVNSNIILYGAGNVGMTYYSQLNRISYCNRIVWVDKNYKLYEEKYGIQSIEAVRDTDKYDYIVIAIYSDNVRSEIIKWLRTIGVPEFKIV